MSPTEMVLLELYSPEKGQCLLGTAHKTLELQANAPSKNHVACMLWNGGGCKLLVDQHGLVTDQQTVKDNMPTLGGCPRGIPLIRTEMQLRPAEFPERGVQGVHVVMCQGFCLGQQKMNPLPPQPFGSFVCPKAAAIDRMSFPF